MSDNKISKSRRATPWDAFPDRSPAQTFIRTATITHYEQRHQSLKDSGEVEFLNSISATCCPYCGSVEFIRYGHNKNGLQKYRCRSCNCLFTILTGPIFDGHKIPVTEWIEYWRNLFEYLSLTADSWNNKNAYNTSKYWFKKTCLLVKNYQDEILLKDTIWYDETFKSNINSKIKLKSNGQKYRGHSKNQICIGVAIDSSGHCYIAFLGKGSPSSKSVYDAFKDHIEEGSTILTDSDHAHRMLVNKLNLVNQEYNAKICKNMNDVDNPLTPINNVHSKLQKFLRAHDGFSREDFEDYLNPFAFMINTPDNKLSKIDILLNRVLSYPNHLSYRQLFRKK
jgi:transposase-like protein